MVLAKGASGVGDRTLVEQLRVFVCLVSVFIWLIILDIDDALLYAVLAELEVVADYHLLGLVLFDDWHLWLRGNQIEVRLCKLDYLDSADIGLEVANSNDSLGEEILTRLRVLVEELE